jgi:cell division protein FtsB
MAETWPETWDEDQPRRARPGRARRLGWLGLCPVLAAVFTVGALALDHDDGLLPLLALRDELGSIRAEVRELDQLRAERKAQVERLRSDPFEIEKAARERHGMVRPGERVLRLENDSALAD